MKRLLCALVTASMVVGAAGCGSTAPAPAPTSDETQETKTAETALPETDGTEKDSLYTPGTYSASAKGFGGDVTVTITVDEEKITDCKAEGPGETEGGAL